MPDPDATSAETPPGPPPPHRRHHRLLWSAVAALVVLAAVGGFGYRWKFVRNDTKPVNVRRVERRFATDHRDSARAGRPAPGVYLYRTTGQESVTALGGQVNHYPATTALALTNTSCGVDTQWSVLTGRYDIARRCRRPDGTWTLASTVRSDRFFNQTQADTYLCTGVVELPTDPQPGQRSTGRCVQGANTTQLTYEVVGQENITVAGRPVPTIHLRITAVQGGGRSGGGTEERWVQPVTNLVVRSIDRESDKSPSPLGEVTYDQAYDITLRWLTPRA